MIVGRGFAGSNDAWNTGSGMRTGTGKVQTLQFVVPIVGAEVGALPEHGLQRERGAKMSIQLIAEIERA